MQMGILKILDIANLNSASTKYINEHISCKVLCEPTGVKYVHKAATKFEIGIYFEANGHGTIHYDPSILKLLLSS